jgi:hypothetical protein
MVQPKRISPFDRAFELRGHGCSPEEIAEILKMPPRSIYRWFGLKMPRRAAKTYLTAPARSQSTAELIEKYKPLADRPDPEAKAKAITALAKWCCVWVDRDYKGDPTCYLNWHIEKDLEES